MLTSALQFELVFLNKRHQSICIVRHTHKHTHTHTHTHTYIQTHTHARTHAHSVTHTYTHSLFYTQTHPHTETQIYAHTPTRTRTKASELSTMTASIDMWIRIQLSKILISSKKQQFPQTKMILMLIFGTVCKRVLSRIKPYKSRWFFLSFFLSFFFSFWKSLLYCLSTS